MNEKKENQTIKALIIDTVKNYYGEVIEVKAWRKIEIHNQDYKTAVQEDNSWTPYRKPIYLPE